MVLSLGKHAFYFDFWDPALFSSLEFSKSSMGSRNDLRSLIDPSWGDEVDEMLKKPSYEMFRREGVILWSRFEFDVRAKVASVWMPDFVVNEMQAKKWEVGVWRSDSWSLTGSGDKI